MKFVVGILLKFIYTQRFLSYLGVLYSLSTIKVESRQCSKLKHAERLCYLLVPFFAAILEPFLRMKQIIPFSGLSRKPGVWTAPERCNPAEKLNI